MTWIVALLAASLIQQPAPAVEMTPAEQAFQQTMSDVVLEGFFTVGDGTELHPDRYVIQSVTKVKDGVWRFAARVQYNKKDFPVTINVPVFFAGDIAERDDSTRAAHSRLDQRFKNHEARLLSLERSKRR